MQLDTSSSHALVLTRQNLPIPTFLLDLWDSMGVPVTVMDATAPGPQRALELRILSRTAARVVLHHHPDDSVPVMAYATGKSSPVILFNHAHFSFGMGTSVAELVINTLPYYGAVSRSRRAARNVDFLVGRGGLEEIDTSWIDKKAAKSDLSLPADSPVCLTIGHQPYFTPRGSDNFFHTALRLLADHPDLTFLFVGVTSDFEHIPDKLRWHKRVKFFGPVQDPRPYYRAADICLESFPMPSLGAVAEAVYYGEAYPVLSHCEFENILRPAIPGWPARARTADEHLEKVRQLIGNLQGTRDAAHELRVLSAEQDRNPELQFERLYALAGSFPLVSKAIPDMKAQQDEDDLILAEVGGNRLAECIDSIPSRALRARCLLGGWARGHLRSWEFRRGIRKVLSG
jgi:hypothetical protein